MVSKGHKRTSMCRNLQLLRSITKSHALQRDSVLLDASQYIQGLKRKLEKLSQEVLAKAQDDIINYDPMPVVDQAGKLHSLVVLILRPVTVEERDIGFLIKVLSQRKCHGLLTFILEAFEELSLDVLSARVTCVDGFCLEALGVVQEDSQEANEMDAQVFQQTVFQAIQKWRQLTTNDPSSS